MRSTVLLVTLLAPLGITAKQQRVSTDATCGGSKGYTCLGSVWGDCCSQYGWCGSKSSYCGSGCNAAFGTCYSKHASSSSSMKTSSTRRASSTAPAATQRVTTDAQCGPKFGDKTCLGSRWGDCCSQYSWCGSTIDYCAAETCQKGYGRCNILSSSSKAAQSSTRTSSSMSQSSSSISSSSLAHDSSVSVVPSTMISTILISTTDAVASSSTSATGVPSSDTSVLSSTSQKSSSSAIASTPVLSTTVSATSTAISSTGTPQPTCFEVSDCEALGKPFTQACSSGSDNTKCVSGYQAKCSSQIYGSVLSTTPTIPTAGDDCIASCTSNASCLGFTFTSGFSATYYCTLYSVIDRVDQGFGTIFRKICDDGSSVGSSSSVTIPESSTVLSISSPASSDIILSTATTSSISSTLDATPSASASASVCPYSNNSCQPVPGATLESACASNNMCTSGYVVICGSTASDRGTIIATRPYAVSADDCALKCDQDSACFGFEYSGRNDGGVVSNTCTFYNQVSGLQAASTSTVYRKRCPITPSILSSSSLEPSATTPLDSSVLSSSITVSTPSSSPSPTECSYRLDGTECPLVETTLANACPVANNKCTSRYNIGCGGSPEGESTISHIYDTPVDADDCALQCDDDPACVGFVYSRESTNDGHFTCTYYSSIGGSGHAARKDTVQFFKYCGIALPPPPIISASDSSSFEPASSTPATSSIEASSSSPVFSDAVVVTPTPSAASCSKFTQPNCPPTDTTSLDPLTACAAANDQCAFGFQIKCDQVTAVEGRTVSLEDTNPVSADNCVEQCNEDGTCIGFEYSYSTRFKTFTCKYLSAVEELIPAPNSGAATYFKQCSETLPVVASSSSAPSSAVIIASTISTISSTTPSPSPLYATSCPSQNAQCLSNYRVACSTSIYQVGSTVLQRINVPSADACVAACTSESTCIAAQMATDEDSSGQCTLYSKIEQSGPFTARFSSFFRGCSNDGTSSSSLASTAISSIVVSSTPSPTPNPTPTPTPTPIPVPGPYANVCPSQNGQCVANYRVACSTYLYSGGATLINIIRVSSTDECVAACTAEAMCVAVLRTDDTQGACALYSQTAGIGPVSNIFTSFFKGCDGVVVN